MNIYLSRLGKYTTEEFSEKKWKRETQDYRGL